MIVGGVVDRFQGLQVIVEHWGEVVRFFLELPPIARLARPVSEYVRIMVPADWPYVPVSGGAGRRFLDEADISEVDREKIASGNWERMCAAIRR